MFSECNNCFFQVFRPVLYPYDPKIHKVKGCMVYRINYAEFGR